MRNLYILWVKEYDLGIPIIDEQHRAIVATINTYHYFVSSGHGRVALKPTFVTLDQYTKMHFMTEENILEQIEYPEINNHRKLHENLMSRMREIAREAIQEKDFDNVLQFLKKWWLNHIRIEDTKYAAYITNKAVEKGDIPIKG